MTLSRSTACLKIVRGGQTLLFGDDVGGTKPKVVATGYVRTNFGQRGGMLELYKHAGRVALEQTEGGTGAVFEFQIMTVDHVAIWKRLADLKAVLSDDSLGGLCRLYLHYANDGADAIFIDNCTVTLDCAAPAAPELVTGDMCKGTINLESEDTCATIIENGEYVSGSGETSPIIQYGSLITKRLIIADVEGTIFKLFGLDEGGNGVEYTLDGVIVEQKNPGDIVRPNIRRVVGGGRVDLRARDYLEIRLGEGQSVTVAGNGLIPSAKWTMVNGNLVQETAGVTETVDAIGNCDYP